MKEASIERNRYGMKFPINNLDKNGIRKLKYRYSGKGIQRIENIED